jgi:large subunit ribosomal protein L17
MSSHRKLTRKFGRDSSHRKALFKNLSVSIIEHECVVTTLTKAKEVRRHLEPLITLAKTNNLHTRRQLIKKLGNHQKNAIEKLLNDIGPRFANRPGGYLRVLKCGSRAGDSAPMAYVVLTDKSM